MSLFDRLQSEMEARQRVEGLAPADLLDLSPDLRRVIHLIARRGEMNLTEIVFELDLRPSEARSLLDTLAAKGYLRAFDVQGEPRYKTFFARRRGRELPLNIWEMLDSRLQ